MARYCILSINVIVQILQSRRDKLKKTESFETRNPVRSGITFDGYEHRSTGEATKKASGLAGSLALRFTWVFLNVKRPYYS